MYSSGLRKKGDSTGRKIEGSKQAAEEYKAEIETWKQAAEGYQAEIGQLKAALLSVQKKDKKPISRKYNYNLRKQKS
jgi:uncharacterized protein YukE